MRSRQVASTDWAVHGCLNYMRAGTVEALMEKDGGRLPVLASQCVVEQCPTAVAGLESIIWLGERRLDARDALIEQQGQVVHEGTHQWSKEANGLIACHFCRKGSGEAERVRITQPAEEAQKRRGGLLCRCRAENRVADRLPCRVSAVVQERLCQLVVGLHHAAEERSARPTPEPQGLNIRAALINEDSRDARQAS